MVMVSGSFEVAGLAICARSSWFLITSTWKTDLSEDKEREWEGSSEDSESWPLWLPHP